MNNYIKITKMDNGYLLSWMYLSNVTGCSNENNLVFTFDAYPKMVARINELVKENDLERGDK